MMWSMAMHLGGHIRFGTEDNIYLRKGVLAQRSLDFVEPLKRLAQFFERPLGHGPGRPEDPGPGDGG